jgi:hypothetical protein
MFQSGVVPQYLTPLTFPGMSISLIIKVFHDVRMVWPEGGGGKNE